MYYEEKIINGVLHFRTSPKENWRAFTIEQLSETLVAAQKEVQQARLIAENLREFWETVTNACDDCPNGDPLPWKLH